MLLRTAAGKTNPPQLSERLFCTRADALEALNEARLHGLVDPLPGVWDGTWWGLTAQGVRVGAWTLVREELPFSKEERRRIDELLGLREREVGGPVASRDHSADHCTSVAVPQGTGIATGTPPGGSGSSLSASFAGSGQRASRSNLAVSDQRDG